LYTFKDGNSQISTKSDALHREVTSRTENIGKTERVIIYNPLHATAMFNPIQFLLVFIIHSLYYILL
jgi:hypothetical protein